MTGSDLAIGQLSDVNVKLSILDAPMRANSACANLAAAHRNCSCSCNNSGVHWLSKKAMDRAEQINCTAVGGHSGSLVKELQACRVWQCVLFFGSNSSHSGQPLFKECEAHTLTE